MIKIKNICIITDFDHTLTTKDSKSSWDVLEMIDSIPENIKQKSKENRKYYLPKEKDEKITFSKKKKYMKEWLEKNLHLFTKCKITKKEIEEISNKRHIMKLKKGVKQFLEYTDKQNIPVIIVSAGISDIIQNYLKSNNILFKNISVISNKIKYKDYIFTGFKNKEIHSLNKDIIRLPSNIISKTEKIIIIGDNIEDTLINTKKSDILKIGFCDNEKNIKTYKKNFDIVYSKETFKEILDIIKNSRD